MRYHVIFHFIFVDQITTRLTLLFFLMLIYQAAHEAFFHARAEGWADRCGLRLLALAFKLMMNRKQIPGNGFLQLTARSITAHRPELAVILFMSVDVGDWDLGEGAAVFYSMAFHLNFQQYIFHGEHRVDGINDLILLNIARKCRFYWTFIFIILFVPQNPVSAVIITNKIPQQIIFII